MSMKVSTYQQAIDFLQTYLPTFNAMDKNTITDLSKIRSLCAWSGHPEKASKFIHVAGTNGKGSVCHLLTSILMEAGYKVGLHTSPHLIDFRERTQVNGRYIEQSFIIDKVNQFIQSQMVDTLRPSFFDVSIWLALEYFKQENTDYVVLETGLGGRKDTTNIVQPLLSVITSIGFDHQAILGNTLREIAFEKAGIIKPNAPVVVGEKNDEFAEVIEEKAKAMNAPIFWANENINLIPQVPAMADCVTYLAEGKHTKPLLITCPLTGIYQSTNFKTVIQAVEVLHHILPTPIAREQIQAGFLHVKTNARLRARWDVIRPSPLVIIDGAHNVSAFPFVIEQLEDLKRKTGKPALIVFGMLKDKNVADSLALFERMEDVEFLFCQVDYKRAMPVEELSAVAEACGIRGKSFATTSQAIRHALDHYPDHIILITGSLYLAGEALQYFEE